MLGGAPCSGVVTTELAGAVGRGGHRVEERGPHARASSARRPAAVVPPGDVTAARSASGVVLALGEQRRRTEQRLLDEACSRSAGAGRRARRLRSAPRRRASRTPARARQAGDRVELRARRRARRCRPRGGAVRRDRGARSVAVAPGAIADAPRPTSAGVFGIARTTGRPGAAASSVAIVTPAAIDSTSVSRGKRRERGARASPPTSPGFTATIDDVGVGDRPRRARHDAHLRELRFELAAAVGIDLRDRDVVGVVTAVEQAADERRAHLPATEQRDASHRREGNPPTRRHVRHPADQWSRASLGHRWRSLARRPGDATRPEERSEPLRTSPNEAGPPAPRASRWRHRSTVAQSQFKTLLRHISTMISAASRSARRRSRCGSRAGTTARPPRRARR